MGDFLRKTNIRLITNVLSHEIGHFIANILLNNVQLEPKVENIVISWDDFSKKPWGRIEYSIKEGVNHWIFSRDEFLCYHTILSLYSGCIWEKFTNCIFHNLELSVNDIQNCYQGSGFKDAQTIGIINNKYLSMGLTKEFAEKEIIESYVKLLNGLSKEEKQLIYNFFKQISDEIEVCLFDGREPKEYYLTKEQLEKLRSFISHNFTSVYEKKLAEILDGISSKIKSYIVSKS
ncbi:MULTISPECIES: hypothetical protein [Weeksellaceae]|uniref:hypothetical protein n=1 Tax=Weeksellaceae TaxID=2762318 RepID=UPI002FC7EA23